MLSFHENATISRKKSAFAEVVYKYIMAVKNTLDGSLPIVAGSGIIPITLTYSNLISATYPSMYTKIGNKCCLYLPSITENPVSSTPQPIYIIVPPEITPTKSQYIHFFSVNDSTGTQSSVLQIQLNNVVPDNVFVLANESPTGNFSNLGPVSITRYRFIIYDINE